MARFSPHFQSAVDILDPVEDMIVRLGAIVLERFQEQRPRMSKSEQIGRASSYPPKPGVRRKCLSERVFFVFSSGGSIPPASTVCEQETGHLPGASSR